MHRKTQRLVLFGGLVLVVAAGCHRPPAAGPGSAPGTTVTEAPGAPGRKNSGPNSARRDAAGPIRLGMAVSDVKKLRSLTVEPLKLKREGHPVEALRVTQFGLPVALAELSHGRVSRVRIFSEKYRTPEGAGIGTSVRQLEKLYGPGHLHTGAGTICAMFDRAPGTGFCFRPVRPLTGLKPGDWSGLRRLNPGVQFIELESKATSGA